MIPDKIAYRIWDWFGHRLCQIAFRSWRWAGESQIRGHLITWYVRPCYGIGSRCYGRGHYAALRCGALVDNPKKNEPHEPLYIWAEWTPEWKEIAQSQRSLPTPFA